MPPVPKGRGAAIREAYESRGLTREQFAQVADIPAKTITNITSGGWCSRAVAARIAMALGDGWTDHHVFAEPEDTSQGAA